jgi:hypothetical protein
MCIAFPGTAPKFRWRALIQVYRPDIPYDRQGRGSGRARQRSDFGEVLQQW